jgi:hypothetical protein
VQAKSAGPGWPEHRPAHLGTNLSGQCTWNTGQVSGFEGFAWPPWAARKLQDCTDGSALRAAPDTCPLF